MKQTLTYKKIFEVLQALDVLENPTNSEGKKKMADFTDFGKVYTKLVRTRKNLQEKSDEFKAVKDGIIRQQAAAQLAEFPVDLDRLELTKHVENVVSKVVGKDNGSPDSAQLEKIIEATIPKALDSGALFGRFANQAQKEHDELLGQEVDVDIREVKWAEIKPDVNQFPMSQIATLLDVVVVVEEED